MIFNSPQEPKIGNQQSSNLVTPKPHISRKPSQNQHRPESFNHNPNPKPNPIHPKRKLPAKTISRKRKHDSLHKRRQHLVWRDSSLPNTSLLPSHLQAHLRKGRANHNPTTDQQKKSIIRAKGVKSVANFSASLNPHSRSTIGLQRSKGPKRRAKRVGQDSANLSGTGSYLKYNIDKQSLGSTGYLGKNQLSKLASSSKKSVSVLPRTRQRSAKSKSRDKSKDYSKMFNRSRNYMMSGEKKNLSMKKLTRGNQSRYFSRERMRQKARSINRSLQNIHRQNQPKQVLLIILFFGKMNRYQILFFLFNFL